MTETKDKIVSLEILKVYHDYDKKEMANLRNTIKAGTIETAEYHMGFYLDENGDLCQKED